MSKSTFVYVIYVRTTLEKLWEALTDSLHHRASACRPRAEAHHHP
jgi:hypothetical protein